MNQLKKFNGPKEARDSGEHTTVYKTTISTEMLNQVAPQPCLFSSLLETVSHRHLLELVAQEKKMLLHPAFFRIYTGIQPTIGVETGREIMIKRSTNH